MFLATWNGTSLAHSVANSSVWYKSANREWEEPDTTSTGSYIVGDTSGFAIVRLVFFVLFLADCVDEDDPRSFTFFEDIKIEPPARRFAFEKPDYIVLFDNELPALIVLKRTLRGWPSNFLNHPHFSHCLQRQHSRRGNRVRKWRDCMMAGFISLGDLISYTYRRRLRSFRHFSYRIEYSSPARA